MTHEMQLEQEWMSLAGVRTSCSIIHPHTTCLHEILDKCRQVVIVSSKLYAVLYLTMFLIRFKKIYRERKVRRTLRSWSSDYLWSLIFMCWTVGGMKSALCLLNYINFPLSEKAAPILSGLASPSLFCLGKSKRYEVSMFTFVRACRSLYIFMKKRHKFQINRQKQLCFVILYGLASLFYFENPSAVMNREILVNLWGQF